MIRWENLDFYFLVVEIFEFQLGVFAHPIGTILSTQAMVKRSVGKLFTSYVCVQVHANTYL